ncbi:hypothetical protein MYX65_09995, partial [Acidobacteria bacterium AH-259-L09]|nr:hypothetical protein [Acidobacteria bacterium AH-259-L09]
STRAESLDDLRSEIVFQHIFSFPALWPTGEDAGLCRVVKLGSESNNAAVASFTSGLTSRPEELYNAHGIIRDSA